jgi:hypothetical protein
MAICGSRVEVLTPPTLPQKPFTYQILAKVLLSELDFRTLTDFGKNYMQSILTILRMDA